MPAQSLTISVSSGTLSALQQSGFHLYAFRPVTSSNKSGVPLVWGRIDTYLETIPLTFTSEALCAYISTDAVAVDAAITMGASIAVSVGQVVSVAAGGGLTVASGAPTGDVYIASAASASYTCGLAAALGAASAQPFCAFALFPQVAVTMQPVDAIFVMWATSIFDPAVYMQQSLGPGLLVGFGSAAQRAVSYDIAAGWQAGGASWAQLVASGADLAAALLLDPGHNHPVMR
jgi:hypothetical protein